MTVKENINNAINNLISDFSRYPDKYLTLPKVMLDVFCLTN